MSDKPKLKMKMKALNLEDLASDGDIPEEVKEAMLEALKGADLPEEAQAIIREVIEKRDGNVKHPSLLEAQAEVLEYYASVMPKIGDLVQLNAHGKARYKMPNPEKNEAAVVLDVFEHYRTDKEQEPVNGIIGVSDKKGIVRTYSVDLRRYSPVKIDTKGTH